MSDGRAIYQQLCEAKSLDAAVSRLSRDQLAEVAAFLGELKPAGGVPAQVWGAVSARLAPVPKPKARRRRAQK